MKIEVSMMNIKYCTDRKLIMCLLILSALALSGCNPKSLEGETVTQSGKVAGFTVFAQICLDSNLNNLRDEGEPSALSSKDGAWTLDIPVDSLGKYPIVAEIVAGLTIDDKSGLIIEKAIF